MKTYDSVYGLVLETNRTVQRALTTDVVPWEISSAVASTLSTTVVGEMSVLRDLVFGVVNDEVS